jgi:hypothetical protein
MAERLSGAPSVGSATENPGTCYQFTKSTALFAWMTESRFGFAGSRFSQLKRPSPTQPRPSCSPAPCRAAFTQEGELSAAIELRRRFPGITENAKARAHARSIAGWTPLPVLPRPVRRAGTRKDS